MRCLESRDRPQRETFEVRRAGNLTIAEVVKRFKECSLRSLLLDSLAT
jgi:hypothetical protein